MTCFDIIFKCIVLITATPFVVNSVDLQELYDLMKSEDIKSYSLSHSKNIVEIKNDKYEIYKYNRKPSPRPDDKVEIILDKFYIYVNCECATWTHNELIGIIKMLEDSYGRFLASPSHDYQNHTDCIICNMVSRLTMVSEKLNDFINVLLNYVAINKYDISIETDFLKSLFSLNLTIDYIEKTMLNITEDNNGEHEFGANNEYGIKIQNYAVIVRILSETLYSIRGFMALNCKCPPHTYIEKQYFAYLENETRNTTDLDRLTNNIQLIKLEPTNKCVQIKKMIFLNSFVNLEQLFDGYQIIWKTSVGSFAFETILIKMKQITDLEFISWCQLYIFKTIMKLIFSETLQLCEQDGPIPNAVFNDLNKLYSEVLIHYTNMPTELKECYLLLETTEGKEEDSKRIKLIGAINIYMQTVYDINITQTSGVTTVRSNDLGSSNTELKKTVLEKLMSQLNNKYDNFKCFIRFLSFVQRENKKYYVPLKPFTKKSHIVLNSLMEINNTNKDNGTIPNRRNFTSILITGNDKPTDCNFLKVLYSLCFNSFSKVNDSMDHESFDFRIELFNVVQSDILTFMSKYKNHQNSKYLQNIRPLIEIPGKNLIKNGNTDSIIRLMFVVMTELNKYALKSCHFLNHKISLINNITIGDIGLYSELNAVKQLMYKSVSISNVESIGLNGFYEFFDKKSSDFKEHNSTEITFMWKGEKLNVQQIYENITNSVTNSFYQFSFLDYYFKFLNTLIFYESNKMFNSNDQMPNEICIKLKLLINNLRYPIAYQKMTSDIISYVLLVIEFACMDERQKKNFEKINGVEKKNLKTQIGYHLEETGVFVNEQTPFLPSTQPVDVDLKKICEKIGKTAFMAQIVDQFYLLLRDGDELVNIHGPTLEMYENFVC